jgi:spermidine synthase
VLFLPVYDRGNVIALAFNGELPFFSLKHLRAHANALEQFYQIEFMTFLKDLKKHNVEAFNRIVVR